MSLYNRVSRLGRRYQGVEGLFQQDAQRTRHVGRCRSAFFSTSGTDKSSSPDGSFRLYDSLSQTVQSVPTGAVNATKGLAFYSCGVTPYAPSHLGHARTYVCLDILRRALEHTAATSCNNNAPPPPLFVMNITDVDDKILAAANETGQAPLDLARRYEAEFWHDMDALNCLRPHVVTRVTEYVDSAIVPYIERILERGMAYQTDDGVYFDVRAYEDKMGTITKYGKLAPPANSEDFFTTLEEPQTQKRDRRDFVLWKKLKDGERMYWASPWGEGRPGWHIECSAMIEAVQTQFKETHTFRMHAGGVDLKFPHHTNEIAQAEAYHAGDMAGEEWIPHWVHTGHLHIDNRKMSKSLKNFITIREMLEDPVSESSLSSKADDFRLWCLGLSGSYRGPATYSPERIQDAGAIRQKLVRFLLCGEEWLRATGDDGTKSWSSSDKALFSAASQALTSSRRALMSDLDGSAYLQDMVRVAEEGNAYLSKTTSVQAPTEPIRSALRTLRRMLTLVGFSDATCRAGLDTVNESSGTTSNVVGGERALLDELVRFRALVRQTAMSELQDPTTKSSHAEEILRLCDDARNRVFPRMGVELVDGKVDSNSVADDDANMESVWKFCVPHTEDDKPTTVTTTASPSLEELQSIPLKDLFTVGQYEGLFSAYDKDGVPTLAADGSELSNRQVKKLQKKRYIHAKRLQHETGK